jgi:hypothetical protein
MWEAGARAAAVATLSSGCAERPPLGREGARAKVITERNHEGASSIAGVSPRMSEASPGICRPVQIRHAPSPTGPHLPRTFLS